MRGDSSIEGETFAAARLSQIQLAQLKPGAGEPLQSYEQLKMKIVGCTGFSKNFSANFEKFFRFPDAALKDNGKPERVERISNFRVIVSDQLLLHFDRFSRELLR